LIVEGGGTVVFKGLRKMYNNRKRRVKEEMKGEEVKESKK
jgi:hypothetical protein